MSAEPGSAWCGVSLGLWVGHRVVVSELPTKVTHSKDTHAMTHDHSALLAQLDALTSADSGSMFAELVRAGLQALIEAEATEKIGASRYERSAERTVHRNGHRAKTVSTPAGDVSVKIPKLRSGSFFPVLLERRRRIDKALQGVNCGQKWKWSQPSANGYLVIDLASISVNGEQPYRGAISCSLLREPAGYFSA